MMLIGAANLTILVLISVGVYAFVRQVESNAWRGRQLDAARSAAQTIAAFLQHNEDILSWIDALGYDEMTSQPGILETVLAQYPDFLEIVAFDQHGRIIAYAARQASLLANLPSAPQSTWFRASQSGQAYYTRIQPNSQDPPYLIFSIPIREKGVLTARLKLDVLDQVVAEIHFGRRGSVFVVDQTGSVIAHTDPAVVLADTSMAGRPEFQAILQAPDRQWQGERLNFAGQRVVSVSAAVGQTDWTVITELPVSEAYAASRLFGVALPVGMFLLLFATTLVLRHSLNTIFLKPVDTLRDGAAHVRDGDLGYRMDNTRMDELGEVMSVFNQMAERLQAQHLSLEQRAVELEASEIRYRLLNEQLEERVQAGSKELRNLSQAVAQSANAIVITDTSGAIEYVNPRFEETTGYSAEEARGQNPRILKSGELSREFYKDLWKTISSGKVWQGEFHNKRKDGTLFWEWATIAPVIDENGTITHFIAVKEDITARKAIEEAEREQRSLAEALRSSAEALNSTLKFDEVLDRILDNTDLVVPYDAVAILLVEGGKLRIARHRGWQEAGWGELDGPSDLQLEDIPGLHAMYFSRETFVIQDISEETHLLNFPETSWARSYAGVPICSRDQVLGFLTLFSARPRFYSQVQADRLKAFASQAAIAIENARLFEQTHYYSITDGLTGLYNSRYFFNLANFEFERVRRYPSSLSVMMIDADYFKSVNDTYGHPVGDEVLRHLAQVIQSGLRKVDVVARYGGEEFVLLMPETDLDQACLVAERLRGLVESTSVQVEGHTISITVSIGVACMGSEHVNFNALVKSADDALYVAKGQGRNRVAAWRK